MLLAGPLGLPAALQASLQGYFLILRMDRSLLPMACIHAMGCVTVATLLR